MAPAARTADSARWANWSRPALQGVMVLWALAMRFQADRDLVIIPNIIGSHLNPTAYGYDRLARGPMETKLIFDATKPLPPYDFPKEAQAPDEVLNRIDLARDTRPYQPGKDDKDITGA